MLKKLAIVVILSTVFHLTIGWMWSVIGAIVGGWVSDRRGWWIGGAGLAISWLALIILSLVQAPSQVAEMARVVAALLGEFPPFTTYLITVLIGGILGVLGGFVGSAMGSFRNRKGKIVRDHD